MAVCYLGGWGWLWPWLHLHSKANVSTSCSLLLTGIRWILTSLPLPFCCVPQQSLPALVFRTSIKCDSGSRLETPFVLSSWFVCGHYFGNHYSISLDWSPFSAHTINWYFFFILLIKCYLDKVNDKQNLIERSVRIFLVGNRKWEGCSWEKKWI
jgi:hypothetical protein